MAGAPGLVTTKGRGDCPVLERTSPELSRPGSESTGAAGGRCSPPMDPPELDYQTELRNGVRVVLPIQTLLQTLLSQTPIDNDAVAILDWPKGREIRETLGNDVIVNYDYNTKLMTVKGVLSDEDRRKLLDFELEDKAAKTRIEVAVNDLYERSKDNTYLTILKTKGLPEFIDFLESKVAQADDAVEFGFLQSRTSMYRVRQQVLGLEDASRLATSSTLADIATRESAYATQKISAPTSWQPKDARWLLLTQPQPQPQLLALWQE